MHAADGQTDGWIKATLTAPFPMVGSIIKHVYIRQEAQLLQRDRTTLHVIEYFAK